MFLPVLGELRWPILERIPLVGDLAVSPHGIFVALGFLMGAQLMMHRAALRGVARRPIAEDTDGIVQSLMTRGAIGAIVGARFFYVVTRLDQFPDPLAWFRVWEGGLSLLGGITGGVLACVPFVVSRRYRLSLLLDSVAPGLALGIFVGRVGDLIIGEHLGGRTDFFLGWRCTGALRDPAAPYPWPGPQVQGCYDAAVHQTALYDFLAGGAILLIILLLERKPRFDGFATVTFVICYGAFRFVSDFAREADLDLIGPLTGSQVAAAVTIVVALAWVLLTRPDRRKPYAWHPPDFEHPWDRADAGDQRTVEAATADSPRAPGPSG